MRKYSSREDLRGSSGQALVCRDDHTTMESMARGQWSPSAHAELVTPLQVNHRARPVPRRRLQELRMALWLASTISLRFRGEGHRCSLALPVSETEGTALLLFQCPPEL